MSNRFLKPQEFLTLLAVPIPFAERWLPISDTHADPGIFGPGSVTWEVLKEPLMILAGGRALLMQAAHPLVAQGAIDHSAYSSDPFGRLMRTYQWSGSVAFGTTREARAASRVVNRLHGKVIGTLPRAHATRRVRTTTAYSAMDGDLLLWVHATFLDTILEAHDRLAGGLSERDRDQFVHEWDPVARLMRVPERLLWKSHGHMRAYIEREMNRGAVLPGKGSRLVAQTILHPPLPAPLRPLWEALTFVTVGFLPPQLRRGYGIFWTPAHGAAHRSLCLGVKASRSTMPRRLRVAPIYDFAAARSRGELEARRTRGRAA